MLVVGVDMCTIHTFCHVLLSLSSTQIHRSMLSLPRLGYHAGVLQPHRPSLT